MRACAIIKAVWRDPVQVLAAFADELFAIGFLSDGQGPRARWSYLAREPQAVLSLDPDDPRDPFVELDALAGERFLAQEGGPPFQGGVAGLAAYELGARVEAASPGRYPGWPDLVCARYDAVLAFDHQTREILAVGRGGNEDQARAGAMRALSWLEGSPPPAVQGPLVDGFAPRTSASEYAHAVAEVVERIAAGEIFQANIARAWEGRLVHGARPFDLVARLAATSPAPFAAYLRLNGLAVASNSPERFIEARPDVCGMRVETRPIKGTRPRGAEPAEDARLAAELSASAKDRAENLMIVDLMRNDLARVCSGIEVEELFRPEAFANVHHLVSTVTGRLAPGRGAADLLRAAFPPGSVTGAPKVQAMKVIADLEPPRGPYCGAMFWIGADGAFDSSVLIRTAVFSQDKTGWRIEARAGAGVVADSDPLAEAAETEAKIAAIARALRGEGR